MDFILFCNYKNNLNGTTLVFLKSHTIFGSCFSQDSNFIIAKAENYYQGKVDIDLSPFLAKFSFARIKNRGVVFNSCSYLVIKFKTKFFEGFLGLYRVFVCLGFLGVF